MQNEYNHSVFRLALLRSSLLVVALCCSSLASGAPDPVSPRNSNGSITKAIPQPDGKVIVAGNFSYIGNVEKAGIARLKADGTLDPTFDAGTGVNGSINLVALQSDGKVLITGAFTAMAGDAAPRPREVEPGRPTGFGLRSGNRRRRELRL